MRPHPSSISLRVTALVACALLGLASRGLGQAAPAVPKVVPPKITQQPSSTSSTGQFVVHGSDLATRGAFCLLCDDTAAALGRLLRDDAKYSIPVVVVLKAPPDVDRASPAITTNISQLAHGGFHLQINAQLRADFKSEEFARELVRVLLAERILRNHAELKTKRERVLPDWVLTGVTQALEFRARSRPSALFTAVFRGGQVFSVDRILAAEPEQLDALSRTIYETSSCAIVLALLDQPDGPVRFGRFLNALAMDNKPDRDLLKEHFPTLGVSKNSLEKWWSLQMATLATPSALESMSVSQTEEKLDEALKLRYEPLPEKKGKEKGKGGKEKDGFKSSAVTPESGAFPFDCIASLETSALYSSIRELLNSLVGESEVAAAPAKDEDADEKTDKKQKKKDTATKEEGKGAKKEPEKKTTDKKAPDKKEPDKKELAKRAEAEKKEQDKKAAADKKEAEKKAAEKKEADKKDLEKKAAEKKEADKKAAEKKEPEKKTADRKDADKKGQKEPGKKDEEKKTPELHASPHRIAQHPVGVPIPAPDEKPKDQPKSKDSKPDAEEAPTAEKRSKWNPANWFRGKGEKPEAETPEKDLAKSKHSKSSPKTDLKPEAPAEGKSTQGTLKDYLVIWKRPDRDAILQRNLEQLNALKNQAHPLYRPLINEYSEVVRKLIQGKDHGAADKLAALHQTYEKISGQAKAVESYLDWYQASETQNYSGTFDDYLKLRDKLQKEIRPRGDAISQYLDSLEKEYEN